MWGATKIYDISVTLGSESIDHPNVTPFRRRLQWSLQDGGVCDFSNLSMSSHSGTHIDLPSHFELEGDSAEQPPIERFILEAQVVLIQDPKAVTAKELSQFDLQEKEAVLFKTQNSVSGICKNGTYTDQYVYLAEDAAQYCVDQKVALVGIDYISIEEANNRQFPAHRLILGSQILVLEGINLEAVPPGRYRLFCLPLKIKNGEASPVRAILMA